MKCQILFSEKIRKSSAESAKRVVKIKGFFFVFFFFFCFCLRVCVGGGGGGNKNLLNIGLLDIKS